MKNISFYMSLLFLIIGISCSSDEVLEEARTEQESVMTYKLTGSFGVPKNAAVTKAVPDNTGEVGANYEFCETYDLETVYLKVNDGTLEIPIYDGADGKRCFDLSVEVGAKGKLTFLHGGVAVEAHEGVNDVYFTSQPQRNVEAAETDQMIKIGFGDDKMKIREPVGDKLFRSDILQFSGVDGKLMVKSDGVVDENPEILRVRMNRCTCVLQPVLIVTDTANGKQLTEESFNHLFGGSLADWTAWAVLEKFPFRFDMGWTDPVNGSYIGNPFSDWAPLQVMNRYFTFTDQTLDGTSYNGVGVGMKIKEGEVYKPSFIYWSNFVGNLLIPIKNSVSKKTMVMRVDLKMAFKNNTHYRAYILVDCNALKAEYDKTAPSTKSTGYEVLDIPYEVVVKAL